MAALSTEDTVKRPGSNGEGPSAAAASTGTSPSKKSVIWDSLWSLDVSLDRSKK